MNRHQSTDHNTAAKVAITVVLTLLAALILTLITGCSTRTVVITEYDAGGGLIRDATVGGCSVSTSDDQVTGALSLKYSGSKCSVDYKTNE